jgi:hypothetical protein
MTSKQTNWLCLAISFMPFMVGLLLFAKLPPYPLTHIIGSNSVNPGALDRQTFLLLILISGLGFYFLARILGNFLLFLSPRAHLASSRLWINAALTLLVYLLLAKNLA